VKLNEQEFLCLFLFLDVSLHIYFWMNLLFGCYLEFKSLGELCIENSNIEFKLKFLKPQVLSLFQNISKCLWNNQRDPL